MSWCGVVRATDLDGRGAGARGMAVRRTEFQTSMLTLLACYSLFWLGMYYHVLLLVLTNGVHASVGWYLYAVVPAEVILWIAGLRAISPVVFKRWIPAAGVLLFALLDLYSLHAVAIPYYTGLLVHRGDR